jgi:alkylhydroperoxidase/carboxymuconolactone decarboxylase family protein YurZ
MNITLFDAAQSVRESLATVDPETGEYTDAYTTSRELFERKGAACVAYAVEETAAIEASEKMLKAMSERVAARKARLDRFRVYVADCMKNTGITKLSCEGLATATLYPERDESVEIDDGTDFPPELCNDPKPPAPSKAKIKAAILAGEPVAGARIVRKDRLTIK